ncbi:type II toxin-antitoxin system RelE/ParE family toxin [Psychromonas hadalis]|uniref:type II toxin-antitoxin system RelE/ParE family toxin n=1 Tax=Psychromonas hadalis TaxID=211669 RepID=UPI0003B55CCE|nr:type II toxin-antitoxin system RelE/ParE family toxin [Psychromonas hadalis]
MNYSVELSPDAQFDIESIYQHYISNTNSQVAEKLLLQIDNAIISLENEPLRGHHPRELQSGISECKEILTAQFRFIYRIENKRVIILIVLHQKQSVQKALANRLLH